MNNKEALKLIIENNQKNKEKYENFVIDDDNEFEFEELLKDLVSYLWIKQYPKHFLNYYVTLEEDYNNNYCAYSWYIAMKNGRFNFKLFKLTGNDKFKLGSFMGKIRESKLINRG